MNEFSLKSANNFFISRPNRRNVFTNHRPNQLMNRFPKMVLNQSVVEVVQRAVKRRLPNRKRHQYLVEAVADQKHRQTMKQDLIKNLDCLRIKNLDCLRLHKKKEFKLNLNKT